MRHRRATVKLGRTTAHRTALLASLVNNLIECKRIRTTVQKAKLARSLADRMVTLAKDGSLHARRRAIAALRRKDRVAQLFEEIAPACAARSGGYTRVIKLGRRPSDGSEMAFLEWVDVAPVVVRRKKKEDEKPAEPTKSE